MSTVIRIDQVPAADRVDFVEDMAASMWVPMKIRPLHKADTDFCGEFRASGLGAMQVVVMEVMPADVRRTPELICQADPDMVKMVLICGGNSCVVEQGGRQAQVSAGDLTCYDTRRPYKVTIGVDGDRPTQVMTFMFPPSMLPLCRSRLKDLTAIRIPAGAGVGDLTSQFLLQLARNIDHYSPAEAARLSTAALEVLATRLAREMDIRDWGTPEDRRHALLTTIQAFIQQHLGDSGLSPAMIAAAHHVSLRSLHQLFHDEGLTVAGWIRRRRLEGCRRDLSDPALDSRPVAAIAARWGFSSPGDFSRTFRAVHGLPPAEYRMSARIVKVPAR
jgi:AraC-like DNA-binding protein